jgi:hypothetical protein
MRHWDDSRCRSVSRERRFARFGAPVAAARNGFLHAAGEHAERKSPADHGTDAKSYGAARGDGRDQQRESGNAGASSDDVMRPMLRCGVHGSFSPVASLPV